MRFFFLLTGIFVLAVIQGQAQHGVIRVLDEVTGQPVGFAHVCFESLTNTTKKFCITEDNGKVDNLAETRSVVAISCIGYKTLFDTIMPGESRIIKLPPAMFNMEQVVVTGQYTPQRTDRSIYKVQVIDSKTIQGNAAVTLEEILSNQLNIKISHDAALGSKMKLQGIGGENVKILIDGVPVIGRMNGDIDLSQINLANIERIEMVEGPMSVSYGTNALAGVINLITKDQVNRSFDTKLNTYFESIGQLNFDVSAGLYKNKNTLLLSGGRTFFDGYSVFDSSRYKQWKPKEQYFADLKYKRRIGKTQIKVSSRYFQEFVLDKGSPVMDADTANNYYFYKARDGHFYTKRIDNNLAWSGFIGNGRYIDVMGAYSWYERKREVYIKNLYTMDEDLSQSPSDFDTTSFSSWVFRGTLSRFIMDTVKLNYQAGFDINLESGTGKKIENKQASIQDYALFVSLKYRPVNTLTIQPGIRFSYNSAYDAPVTPSVNLMYDLGEYWVIRGSYGKGFRAPSLKELYLDFVDLNHKIFGSDSLKAEYSNSYQMSLGYKRETQKVAFKIEPDFFYNQVKDKIDLIPKSVVGVNHDTTEIWVYSNIDYFNTLGGRLNITYKHKGILDFGIGFAYIGTRNHFDGVLNAQNDYRFYPEMVVNVQHEIRWTGINLGIIYKFNGEVTQNRLNSENELIPYTEESYHMMDLTLSRSFLKDRLQLSVGAKNLFDVTEVKTSGSSGGGVHSSGSTSMPVAWGRSFFAGLKFNISK